MMNSRALIVANHVWFKGEEMETNYLYYRAINWNVIEDKLDNATWERATSLFWLDTRIPIEEDKEKWLKLSKKEQEQLNRLLLFLTYIATYQSIETGEIVRDSESSQQEVAIINNLQFTEMVNTKAYNQMLRVFNEGEDLNDKFDWINNETKIQQILTLVDETYNGTNPIAKRFMALCVEGLINLAFIAFPMQLWVKNDFTNMGHMLEMIIRNESLHCIYLGHKINILSNDASKTEIEEFKLWADSMVKNIVQLLHQSIERFYLVNDDKEFAKQLIEQEANYILGSVGLNTYWPAQSNDLDEINKKLRVLRKHDLDHIGAKNTVYEDSMTEDDYIF